MRLIPKNWESFQHYKNRRPHWIKLHKSLLDDYEFHCLPVASRALAPCLWLLASDRSDGIIDAPVEKLAFRLRMTVVEFEKTLKPLIDAGFFKLEQDASNVLADCKQSACLEKRREKRREEREGRAPISNLEFDRFKAAYPKRGASNPWKPAAEKFAQLVESGVKVDRIIEGAKAYKAECERRKIIDTEIVAQAKTWLNQERFNDYAEQAKTPEQFAKETDAAKRRGYEWNGVKWVKTEQSENIGETTGK